LAGFAGQKHQRACYNSFIDVTIKNRGKVCIWKGDYAFSPCL